MSITASATEPEERVVFLESNFTVTLKIRSIISGSTTSGVIATKLKSDTADFISAICDVEREEAPVGFAEINTLPN